MARLIGILVLIALGSAVAGILCAFLLHDISQRFQKRRQALFQNKVNLITTETTKQPVATTVIGGINKLNGHKRDALEILFKNHNNMLTFEKYRISPKLNVEEPEIINRRNISVVVAQKQSSKHSVLIISEIINQKSIIIEGIPKESPKLNALQQQTIVDYKNTPTSENQIESRQLGVLKGPEIISHKEISMVRKPKKLSKGNTSREQETLKQKHTLAMEEPNQSPIPDFSREPEIINPKRPYVAVRKNESPQSDIIKELETNLAIATTPWSDKLLPFQTSCWDSRLEEDEPLLTTYIEDLIQLYIDVGLANNIVWMATEFGHRSKALDESYMKLSASIAERIKHMMSLSKMG